MKYYDVLYGKLDLDDIVERIIDKCWEVRRLKNVGMMNFRSISMLPLTQCSRLEHAIGTSYLAQRFASSNSFDKTRRQTLIAAALLHDISCAPFGHSVEWALMAAKHVQNHEVSGLWTLSAKTAAATEGRPTFLDSPPFDVAAFDLDGVLYGKLQQGVPGFIHIKSSGMDLDNIDNVYRMGHYLGFQSASIEHVFPLVDSLRVPPDSRVFAISADTACKAEDWHILRESVYREFIYSPEYLSFECQIFHLVDSLAAILKDPKEIASLANVPDDVLLWQYFNDDSFQSIRPLLRRLIALQSYNCLYFGRVDAPDICNALPSATHLAHFKSAFIQTILNAYSDSPNSVISDGPVARWINLLRNHHALPIGPIHIHITTDKRKTNRHLELLTYDRDNSQASMSIGYDSYFVVGALFSEVDLQPADHAFLAQAFARTLSEWSGSQVDTSYRPPVSGMHQLSLGI